MPEGQSGTQPWPTDESIRELSIRLFHDLRYDTHEDIRKALRAAFAVDPLMKLVKQATLGEGNPKLTIEQRDRLWGMVADAAQLLLLERGERRP